EGLDQLRKQHQMNITQFHEEIRVLHRRIDVLESAARVDGLTLLLNRTEIERHVQSAQEGACVLMMRVSGLRMAEVHFRASVAEVGEGSGKLADRVTAFFDAH